MTAKDRYIECAQKGMTQAETAKALGISRQAVNQMAERHGIVFADGVAKPIDPEEFGALVGAGFTRAQIAEKFGVSVATISVVSDRLGLTPRNGKCHSLKSIADVLKGYDAGMTQTQIAQATGLSRREVSRQLVAAGRRTQAEAGTILSAVIELHLRGLSVVEIAKAIGRSTTQARATVHYARQKGMIE